MSIPRPFTPTLALLAIAASCADSGFVPTPGQGWGRGDTIQLRCPCDGQTSARLVARIDRTYPYRELWLSVNGNEIRIPAEKTAGVGITEATTDITPDDSVLNITHRMAPDTLRGVISLGLANN
ncbi:MAG: hypothetical protein HUK04_05835 [Bacteroidaceae bacterium]|nr:hypothetical protein [Bacteroidaceae bacterium]